jgi:hypothetical protein
MSDTGPAIVIPPPAQRPRRGPGWPDARGWVIVGFFALEFYMLYLIKEDGTLLANAAFMQVMAALTQGGVILIATNLFGGTRSGAEMNAKVGDALTGLANKDVQKP